MATGEQESGTELVSHEIAVLQERLARLKAERDCERAERLRLAAMLRRHAIVPETADLVCAERAVRDSELRWKTMADALPNLVWTDLPDGTCDWLSSQWGKYTGIPEGELLGLRWLDRVIHPDDRERTLKCWRAACEDRGEYDLEYRIRRHDGEYRWFKTRGVPVRDESGKIVYWFGTCTDIEEHKRSEAALRESEERLSLALDTAGLGFWDWDVRTGEVLWNAHHEVIFGYAPGQPRRTYRDFADRILPDDLPRIEAAFRRAIDERKEYRLEHRVVWPDGTTRWVEGVGRFHFDESGNPIRSVGVLLDFTQRKLAEEAQVAAKAAAEAANLAKSRFLANMSHELRTPMNAILGMIDVALPKANNPTVLDCLQTMKGSADLLLTLLNDLLDSAKIDAGKMELEASPFSLREMLEQLGRVLSLRAGEKGLSFFCRVAEETPDAIVGDRMRLQQVLLNLAGNGIKFTERGLVEITVAGTRLAGPGTSDDGLQASGAQSRDLHSSLRRPGVDLAFAVRDTGIGISPADVERLFEPFAQADASTARRFGGTSLGLSISKNLIEMMGGHMRVKSELNRGSTFSFVVRLPLAAALPAALQAIPVVPESAATHLRILVVEDNPANQKLATYILVGRGHAVEIAGNGEDALQLVCRNRYDVILMDVQMPGMSGLDAAAAIRREENGGNRVPIIAMTAYAMASDRERCLAHGMDGYLSKPVNAREMIGLVESLAFKETSAEQAAATAHNSAEASSQLSAVFDAEEALSKCYGSQYVLREMIQCFFDDVDNLLPKMRATLETGDLEEVGRLGHRMKGTLLHLGGESAKKAAGRVEQFGAGGTQVEARHAIDALERECIALRSALIRHLLEAGPTSDDAP